jgi:alkylation response protein AidB-like acyl-CoA dehydrogenase
MDYLLTEEQRLLQELARQVANERIKPIRAELDEHEIFPRDLMHEMAQADLFGVIIPEEYGGLGMGCLESCLLLEAIGTACVGVGITYAATFLGAYPFMLYGTEAHKSN